LYVFKHGDFSLTAVRPSDLILLVNYRVRHPQYCLEPKGLAYDAESEVFF